MVKKVAHQYQLDGFDNLKPDEISELIQICDKRISQYIYKRGKAIWEHRRKSKGYISGSIKYEVLKRANFRCELCGISSDEKALEVDHIVPRNLGGEDSINNYQALCYYCNAMKRDTDSTDFRQKIKYEERAYNCVFCNIDNKRMVARNNLSYAVRDNYPVTEFHSLIIPFRHEDSFFDLTQPEINSIYQLIEGQKAELSKADNRIKGFNIGINQGTVAGQTIPHYHVHLIPRREGDVANPRGGVRHVIPGKGYY